MNQRALITYRWFGVVLTCGLIIGPDHAWAKLSPKAKIQYERTYDYAAGIDAYSVACKWKLPTLLPLLIKSSGHCGATQQEQETLVKLYLKKKQQVHTISLINPLTKNICAQISRQQSKDHSRIKVFTVSQLKTPECQVQ